MQSDLLVAKSQLKHLTICNWLAEERDRERRKEREGDGGRREERERRREEGGERDSTDSSNLPEGIQKVMDHSISQNTHIHKHVTLNQLGL